MAMLTNGEYQFHPSNSVMYHHYISANLPMMDPPIYTCTTYTMSPVVRVFTENPDIDLIPEVSVELYLKEHGLEASYVSLSDEGEIGIFVEMKHLKGVIDLFYILRKRKIRIPISNSPNGNALIKLKGEISFLPPPSALF